MGRLDTSKAAELRVLADRFRRRAQDMSLKNYIELMRKAAADLETEASALEHEEPIPLGRHLDIHI